MAFLVRRKDNEFQVEAQGVKTDWLPDTASNRKAVVVFLRLLVNDRGKPRFSFQQLSQVVESHNRQAASEHMEAFRASGRDFVSLLRRQRKVNPTVVEATLTQLKADPLAKVVTLKQRVNHRLGRGDISEANITAALEQISAQPILAALGAQLEGGKAHYRERYLLEELMRADGQKTGQQMGMVLPESKPVTVSDPTAIGCLLEPNAPLTDVSRPLKWIAFLMVLYYHGIPLSVLGRFSGVHKTTVLRWVIGLTYQLWPEVSSMLLTHIKATKVYIDEKWIKIGGKWHYWFVVLDHQTQLPLLASLLTTRSQWACRWIGIQLKRMGQLPKVIITDGLASYRHVTCGVKHLHCRFHHQQSVTHWLNKHFSDSAEIETRKKQMKRVFQTTDKRTVKRRLQKLKAKASGLGIGQWVSKTEANLSSLLPTIGSRKYPSTTNAIERFFRAFNRFYKPRCGFFSVVSAKKELIFFLLMYLFVVQAETGKAPIEAIVPQARQMPFYQLVNYPFGALMGTQFVKPNMKPADSDAQRALQCQI